MGTGDCRRVSTTEAQASEGCRVVHQIDSKSYRIVLPMDTNSNLHLLYAVIPLLHRSIALCSPPREDPVCASSEE
jgi:hypothetical protein